jgi:hypothetical protein
MTEKNSLASLDENLFVGCVMAATEGPGGLPIFFPQWGLEGKSRSLDIEKEEVAGPARGGSDPP